MLRGIKYARHPKEPLGALYSYEGTLLSNVGRLREALSFQLVAHATDEWGAPKTAKLARTYANIGEPARSKRLRFRRGFSSGRTIRASGGCGGTLLAFTSSRPMLSRSSMQWMRRRLRAKTRMTIWRSFIKAKAAHSERLTAETVLQIREAADQGKISRENEIMMLAALGETRQAIGGGKFRSRSQTI